MSLYEAYNQNEVLADENMKGKLVRVTGAIASIDKNFTDSIVINLLAKDEFTTASLEMNDSEKNKVLKLRKGQHVTITCESMMRVLDSPSGSDCVLN
ncbi:OB-fold protein [Enterobacter asburiae]|uniref:OB-fold protein n=1 Tax=Enterobacter asburiae TaxID=61645 RepID=UPI00387DCC13